MTINCPCCGELLTADPITYQNRYQLRFCQFCDFSCYIGATAISNTDYEESGQYLDYHEGSPRLLWQHKVCIRSLTRLSQLSRFKALRILDFGCFDGFFVSHLRSLNFEAIGVDWNAKAIEFGLSRYGLNNYLSTKVRGSFDVVCALEVIEHFERLDDFFELVDKHLGKDGYLILSCPSSSSIYRPLTDFPPHHFSRFNPANLKLLLERQGYEVCDQFEEMSIAQLLRNWVGDLFRASSRAKDVSSSMDVQFSNKAKVLRRSFNSLSYILNVVLAPCDWVLKKLGFRYLGQVAIAKRVS